MSKKSINQTKKVYGWYSPTQHTWKKDWKNIGTNKRTDCYIYHDEYGNEVICTEVSGSNISTSKFNDILCLGIVTRWIRNDVKPIQNVSQLTTLKDIIVNF
jgi:hypothetical protein